MIDWEFVQIAVEAPLPYPLTYRLPKDLAELAKPGMRVKVPLGSRSSKGVLLGQGEIASNIKESAIKPIASLMDQEPTLDDKTMRWLKWLAQYYLHPPGQVYSMAFAPAGEVRKRKSKKSSPTDFGFDKSEPEVIPTPNAAQQSAIDEISKTVNAKKFEAFLLYGVTGSGKTEVYLRTIEETLKAGQQALVLVPEISLTPQLIRRFVRRFGENVAVIHSHLTERERADQWWSAVKKEKKILVGARSALFCPLENLGLIIVDEEHETSFKQEEQLKYNARDAAIMRAQMSDCPIVLGSATPSLESWQNVQTNKYKLLTLPSRVENRPLPEIVTVDMRENKKDRKDSGLPFWMSKQLFNAVEEVLHNKQQTALFLNRRGFAQFVMCPGCGYSEECPNCSVTLTVHGKGLRLDCHYCGFQKQKPERCPSCKEDNLLPLGLGTEKVCEDLAVLFPEARVARADRDEIQSRESLENLLDKINKQEVDIIVGTQMIAKGHDFPNLTLVGAVLADVGLHFPDFRSSERTFQLLMQVAGRAGRHEKAGRVIVQTYLPEHPAIIRATTHDFANFAKDELASRKELNYPPFGKLATVRIQGMNLPKVENTSDLARNRIQALQDMKEEYKTLEVLGPCESPLAKVRGKYRYHILLKVPSAKIMNSFLQHLLKDLTWVPSGVKVSIDVDPLQLL